MPRKPESRLADLARRQHGAFSRRQARRVGAGPQLLRRLLDAGLLTEPLAGVLVHRAAPTTWRQRLIVPTLAGAGAAVSHRAAAALWELDRCPPGPVEVSLRHATTLRASGVRVHRSTRFDAIDTRVIDAIRVTTPERTLCDLGVHARLSTLEAALDDALRRRLTTHSRLLWTLGRLHRPGQRGTSSLRRLLAEREPGERLPDSFFERLLERCLRLAELDGIVRQFDVVDPDGTHVARLDLAVPSLRLGVEAHSERFHVGACRERRDAERHTALQRRGWEIVYVSWHDLRRPANVATLVADVARHRRAIAGS